MKSLIHKRLSNPGPFVPFTVSLSDGRSFKVPHRDFIAVSKKVVVIIDTDDLPVSISPNHIVSINDMVTRH